jgi:DNA-binding response OmpR family regulator
MEIRVARDAKEGFKMVESEEPCLVILDVFMPGKNGLNVLNEIRHNPRTSRTPVLMLTGDQRFEELAVELGADGYLTKPFRPAQLRQRISDILHK